MSVGGSGSSFSKARHRIEKTETNSDEEVGRKEESADNWGMFEMKGSVCVCGGSVIMIDWGEKWLVSAECRDGGSRKRRRQREEEEEEEEVPRDDEGPPCCERHARLQVASRRSGEATAKEHPLQTHAHTDTHVHTLLLRISACVCMRGSVIFS